MLVDFVVLFLIVFCSNAVICCVYVGVINLEFAFLFVYFDIGVYVRFCFWLVWLLDDWNACTTLVCFAF